MSHPDEQPVGRGTRSASTSGVSTRPVFLLPRLMAVTAPARPLLPVYATPAGDGGPMQWHDRALAAAWASIGGVLPRVHAIACWSGGASAGRGDEHGHEPDGLFEADPRSWGPSALAALSSFVDDVVLPGLRGTDARVWLRPHARHVLCDSVRAERFVLARVSHASGADAGDAASGGGIRLMADPSALLTRVMLARADDHFERAMESIARVGAGGGLGAVVLTNIAGPGGDAAATASASDTADPEAFTADDGPALVPTPLHRGVLRREDILGPVQRWLDPHTPLVLLDEEVEAQLELLRSSGVLV